MKLSKVAMKRLVLLALAIACLVPAMPAAAEPERPSRTAALAALKKSDAEERRRGARGLAIVGRMEDAPKLIAALRDADERVRAVAELALWAVWSRSGDARVDELFSKGVAEMGEQRFPEAIATFTRIIELKPGFAEGWNKRATAYFLAGEFRNRAIQRLRKLPEDQDRCVADPGFQVSEMPFRHTGLSGQHLARHATARAQCSNALTQNAEEWIANSIRRGGSLMHICRQFSVRLHYRALHVPFYAVTCTIIIVL